MKNFQKISLFSLLCVITSIYSADKFPPYSTDDKIYTVTHVDRPLEDDSVPSETPIILKENTENHYFDNGTTHTKISELTQSDKITTTTETWITKNPSYLTWTNAAAVGSVLIATNFVLNDPFGDLITGNWFTQYPFEHTNSYTLAEAVEKGILSEKDAIEKTKELMYKWRDKKNWKDLIITEHTYKPNRHQTSISKNFRPRNPQETLSKRVATKQDAHGNWIYENVYE